MKMAQDLQAVTSTAPIIGRLTLLSIAPVTLILTVVITDHSNRIKEVQQERDLHYNPNLHLKAGWLVEAFEREREEAMVFVANGSNNVLEQVKVSTNTLLRELEMYSYELAELHGAKSFREVFDLKAIVQQRSLLQLATVSDMEVLLGYASIIADVSPSLFALEELRNKKRKKGIFLTAANTLLFAKSYFKLYHSLAFESNNQSVSQVLKAIEYRASEELLFQLFYGAAAPMLQHAFHRAKTSKQWKSTTAGRHIHESLTLKKPVEHLPEWFTAQDVIRSEAALKATDVSSRAHARIDDNVAHIDNMSQIDVTIIVISFLFLVSEAILIVLQSKDSGSEDTRKRALQQMVDTVNRVAEYTSHFALFDLAVPQLPAGKTLTSLELVLMRCMGGLKIAAPALPPELFPDRYLVKAENPCAMELMMCLLPKHHNEVDGSHSKKLSGPDICSSKETMLMTERAKLKMQEVEASVLTVSFTWLHDPINEEFQLGKPSKFKNVDKYMALVESVTVRHHGLVHAVTGDRMICTWNVALVVPNHVLMACKAALCILPECSNFKTPTTNLQIASAVTIGTVIAGNTGFAGTKEVQHDVSGEGDETEEEISSLTQGPVRGLKVFGMFGPAVELGGRIAFMQKLYNSTTAVFCDSEVAARVENDLAVKPLEPIRRSDIDSSIVSVYSIIGVHLGRQSEQAVSLALFKDAYDLFTQRKFLEAEKAFCHYTKVYGYDNVVERLQKLVSLGKTHDETCSMDIHHL